MTADKRYAFRGNVVLAGVDWLRLTLLDAAGEERDIVAAWGLQTLSAAQVLLCAPVPFTPENYARMARALAEAAV